MKFECYQCFEIKTEDQLILIYDDVDKTTLPICETCYQKNKEGEE